MPRSSSARVRFALVGIFAALALAFVVSPGHAQYGRPPGGFSGRPSPIIPPMRPPGGITGIHGTGITGISGIHGGITGISGGITGIHGTGISGIGGAPGMGFGPSASRDEWRCSGCNHLVGTGPFKPLVASCPKCNVRFTNGLSPGGFGTPGPSAPPARPPSSQPNTGTANTPPPAPTLPTNPAVATSAPAPTETPPAAAGPAPTNPPVPEAGAGPAPSAPPSGGRSRTYAVIGIVVGALLLVGALVALGIVVSNNAATPVKRKVKRRVLDDDE